MSTDIEDLLREGMERFTADLQAPAGLTHGIARRRRRRRLALGSVTGAVAALSAGAVALAVAVVPSPRHGGIDLTAYVVTRVSSALTAAERGDIAQVSVTTSSAAAHGKTVATTVEEWSYGDEWRSVTYSSPGHPLYDDGFSKSASSSVSTLVNYRTRTWARQPAPGGPIVHAIPPGQPIAYGCEPRAAADPLLFQFGLTNIVLPASTLPSTVARSLRAAVSCGTLTAAGRQRIDGTEAIKLTSRPGSFISVTIWVSPSTYLPVRAAVRSAPGAPGIQQTADITWLAPTAQNLARLAVPIPAGFRHVSFHDLAASTFSAITAALVPVLWAVAPLP